MNKERTLCEVYSRVVGWFTPVSNWNKGKASEWKDRQHYNVKNINYDDKQRTE